VQKTTGKGRSPAGCGGGGDRQPPPASLCGSCTATLLPAHDPRKISAWTEEDAVFRGAGRLRARTGTEGLGPARVHGRGRRGARSVGIEAGASRRNRSFFLFFFPRRRVARPRDQGYIGFKQN